MSSVVEDTKEHTVWYFAIGSMINKVSLNNRGIVPIKSSPAQIYGYDLQFLGRLGMATALVNPEASFHGVLHLLTNTDMIKLDTIESGYHRLPGRCVMYDGLEGLSNDLVFCLV
jgi:hypothetical protein